MGNKVDDQGRYARPRTEVLTGRYGLCHGAAPMKMNHHDIIARLKAWIGLARPPFHTVGILPFILGSFLAWKIDGTFDATIFLLGVLAIVLIMLSTYHAGEYFDHVEDEISKRLVNNRFSGGSGVIPSGVISRQVPFWTSLIAFAVAAMIGLVLQFGLETGPYTLVLGCWGALPGFFYSTRPIRLVQRGRGEITIGCCYDWLSVASACNLTCIHCHAVSGEPDPKELSTDEGKRLIDQIAEVEGFRTLVFTGGEPLVRPDLLDLLKHSNEVGFANIIATNGTLIDEDMAWKLKEHGVVCNAVSVDAPNPDIHNHVRNSPQAFNLVLRAIEATKKAGILLQINTTAMEYNMEILSDLIDFADGRDASIMLMYQLVAVGRGEKIEKATLKKSADEYLSGLISRKQKHVRTIIEPVAGPQYWPYLLEKKGHGGGMMLKFAEKVFHGCAAGRGFAYIKSNGDVWPCPFVEVNAGNIREKSFREIYEESPVFKNLRNRENTLKGFCGDCRYRKICGGCRGRAHAYGGDYLAEDPAVLSGSRG
ncbi:MAG: hypothetical protein C0394_00420 [Syntrophus sp. (in: bacteria)]|nr:hypothetical protein [Syntrophus sp. (in: bacteria)]